MIYSPIKSSIGLFYLFFVVDYPPVFIVIDVCTIRRMSHTTFVVNKTFEALRLFDSKRSEFVHHASELLISFKRMFVLFYILPYRLYHVVVLVVLGYVVYECVVLADSGQLVVDSVHKDLLNRGHFVLKVYGGIIRFISCLRKGML